MTEAVPLSELLGSQVNHSDKVVIDHALAHPGGSDYEACIQGYPTAKKGGAARRVRNIEKKPEVKRYLEAMRREMAATTGIKINHALMEIASTAYSNIYEYFDFAENGESITLKNKNQISTAQQRAVKQLKVKNNTVTGPDGTVTKTCEVTLQTWDKQRAWEHIGRLLGWNGQSESDLPEGVRQLIQVGVLVLPQNQTVEDAVKTYLPYDAKTIDAEK